MKKILALILALTLALGTVACGNSAPANGGAAGASGDPAVPAAEGMQETPDMVLRLSEDQSPDFPTTLGCQKFADFWITPLKIGDGEEVITTQSQSQVIHLNLLHECEVEMISYLCILQAQV